jgi:uncharacterized membrane protein
LAFVPSFNSFWWAFILTSILIICSIFIVWGIKIKILYSFQSTYFWHQICHGLWYVTNNNRVLD